MLAMPRTNVTLALMAAIGASGAAAHAQIITNGGFESPSTTGFAPGAPTGFAASGYQYGAGVQTLANAGITAADPDGGTQVGYVNTTNGSTTTTISQTTTTALAAATTYVFTGSVAGAGTPTSPDVTFNLFALGTGGALTSLGFVTTTGSSLVSSAFTHFSISFDTATKPSVVGQTLAISIVGNNSSATGNSGANYEQANIDNLAVTAALDPTPEPSSPAVLGLGVLGLGVMALASRRRTVRAAQ